MKTKSDFTTNSSSSSFLAIFARIADAEKARPFVQKFECDVYTGEELLEEMKGRRWSNLFEYDWAGVDVTPEEDYLMDKLNDEFVFFSDSFDIDESDGDPNYDVDLEDFSETAQMACCEINENNGFADVESGYGAGRNG